MAWGVRRARSHECGGHISSIMANHQGWFFGERSFRLKKAVISRVVAYCRLLSLIRRGGGGASEHQQKTTQKSPDSSLIQPNPASSSLFEREGGGVVWSTVGRPQVVPEGQTIIARRFNAGTNPEMTSRPNGTFESGKFSAIPAGLMILSRVPGVKTPGYCREVPPGQRRFPFGIRLAPLAPSLALNSLTPGLSSRTVPDSFLGFE